MGDKETRQDLHQRCRDDLLKRQLSNSENFDRAVLTLSSAALGLSIAFIKNVVDIERSTSQWLLTSTWILLVFAVIITVVSFHLSQAGIKRQIDYAGKYYLEEKDEYLEKVNLPARLNDWAGYLSAASFVAAVICLVAFVSINLGKKGSTMSNEKASPTSAPTEGKAAPSADTGPASPVTSGFRTGGAAIPQMQQVPGDSRGAPVPAMQTVPQSQPAGGESAGGGLPASSEGGGGQSGGGESSGSSQSGGSTSGGGDS